MAKVKMKTNKTAAKRFKVTAKGKIKYWKGGVSHYNTKKSSKRKRQGRKADYVPENIADRVKQLIPYQV
ncbi:MAG TPA: 50S ribosomal protein L35 [Persephonella sp.]|uniref:Large ribosomal subunit protein bL35 n=1 Tax=Persephonella marina (strain DSM 14350 / EX-H1) TaxID=123214 RepID=RL35_PERMH|nr:MULTISPECIES: 50S ribosomal protein L35 [Persephonella]C0QT57.1 RecName: Full=Large ribosomal subunit protein bL35; AltName: Full=50S ribosomal protein L35 [Persephonella marina EX-H1]ACO04593.1 ribosomal protein L35 [Persephonella marina EX-H1]HCB70509.1 50S ribosomal protein L35 [Persephonella sp.]